MSRCSMGAVPLTSLTTTSTASALALTWPRPGAGATVQGPGLPCRGGLSPPTGDEPGSLHRLHPRHARPGGRPTRPRPLTALSRRNSGNDATCPALSSSSTLPAGPARALPPSCDRPSASLRDVASPALSTKPSPRSLWRHSLSPPCHAPCAVGRPPPIESGPGVLPCRLRSQPSLFRPPGLPARCPSREW